MSLCAQPHARELRPDYLRNLNDLRYLRAIRARKCSPVLVSALAHETLAFPVAHFMLYVISSAVICLRYLMLTKQRSLSSSTLGEGLPLRPCTLDILSLSCSPSKVLFTKFNCIFDSSPFKIRSDVSVVCYISKLFLAKHLILCSVSKVYSSSCTH